MKKLTSMLTAVVLAMTLSASASADDHMPSAPVIAELYECSLNDGCSPDQVVALGHSFLEPRLDAQKLINLLTNGLQGTLVISPFTTVEQLRNG